MVSVQVYAQPSEVSAEQGQVIVEGPDGVAVSLTADAAEETGLRLLQSASEAREQLRDSSSPEAASRAHPLG